MFQPIGLRKGADGRWVLIWWMAVCVAILFVQVSSHAQLRVLNMVDSKKDVQLCALAVFLASCECIYHAAKGMSPLLCIGLGDLVLVRKAVGRWESGCRTISPIDALYGALGWQLHAPSLSFERKDQRFVGRGVCREWPIYKTEPPANPLLTQHSCTSNVASSALTHGPKEELFPGPAGQSPGALGRFRGVFREGGHQAQEAVRNGVVSHGVPPASLLQQCLLVWCVVMPIGMRPFEASAGSRYTASSDGDAGQMGILLSAMQC